MMATVSFDTTFELKKECVDSFFTTLEKTSSQPPLPDSPYVNKKEQERGEQLLKKYYSRQDNC